MDEIFVDCDLCEHCWSVKVPDGNALLYLALAAKTGYVCPHCAGTDPTVGRYPARLATQAEVDALDEIAEAEEMAAEADLEEV